MDEDILVAMKESGCRRIQYGIETFSSLTKKSFLGLKKFQKFLKIKNILLLTNSLGIAIRDCYMIGYPQDNRSTILKFKNDLKKLHKDLRRSNSPLYDLRISFFTPFPTTPLYWEYKNKGLLLTEDFSKYTTDTPVVKCGVASEELIKLRKEIYQEINQ